MQNFIIKQINTAKNSFWAPIVYYFFWISATVVTYAANKTSPAHSFFKSRLGDFAPVLGAHKGGIFVVALAVVVGFPASKEIFNRLYDRWCPPIKENRADLIYLLSAVDAIAGSRLTTLETLCDGDPAKDCCDILRGLSENQRMNMEIFQGIREYFQNYSRSKGASNFTMSVIECKDKTPVNGAYYFWWPTKTVPAIEVKDLFSGKSIAKECSTSSRIKVVENVNKEKAFLKFSDPALNKGSMLCYPVIVNKPQKDIAFLITLHVDNEGVFDKSETENYNKYMESFALRLRLEKQFKQLRANNVGTGKTTSLNA